MYNNTFYDIIREGCISSARKVIADFKAFDQHSLASVIDVGCGEGHWGAEFARQFNCDLTFIDKDGFESPHRCYKGTWLQVDMATEDFPDVDRHSLAICLELAEHLPESRADDLVKFLVACSDQILFSAAIPGQGGLGHINEQWPNYWINRFNDLGYWADPLGVVHWGDIEVEPWYQQNLYHLHKMRGDDVCVRQNIIPTIHPAFWATKTGVSNP